MSTFFVTFFKFSVTEKMKNLAGKFKENFKNFSRTAQKSSKKYLGKSEESLMKFCKSGIHTKFIKKPCKFLYNLFKVILRNFRKNSKKIFEKLLGKFEN